MNIKESNNHKWRTCCLHPLDLLLTLPLIIALCCVLLLQTFPIKSYARRESYRERAGRHRREESSMTIFNSYALCRISRRHLQDSKAEASRDLSGFPADTFCQKAKTAYLRPGFRPVNCLWSSWTSLTIKTQIVEEIPLKGHIPNA